jgi:hypothetical protein
MSRICLARSAARCRWHGQPVRRFDDADRRRCPGCLPPQAHDVALAALLLAWAGLALCAVALYNAFAVELEDARRRTMLAMLRWGSGRPVINGDAPAQTRQVGQEAGSGSSCSGRAERRSSSGADFLDVTG